MIPAGAHWGYVLVAYGMTALIIGALVAWLIIDGRRHQRRLSELEARGIRRRSAGDGHP